MVATMRDFLRQRIAELDSVIEVFDRQIHDAEQKKLVAVAERRAYQDALDHLPIISGRNEDTRKHGRSGVRSGNWRAVFEFIARRWPDPTTNDQMMAFALSNGLTISRQSLRAQLSAYTEKGSLERADYGVYRVTAQGAAELGITLSGNDGASGEDPLIESVVEPGAQSSDRNANEASDGFRATDASKAGEEETLAQSSSPLGTPPFPGWEKGR
jgi:hypothetical protein